MYDSVKSMPSMSTKFGDRLMATGAGEGPEGDGDMPDAPFVIIRAATNQRPVFMPSTPEMKVKQQRYQVWIHWKGGDTDPSDALAKELEDQVPPMAGVRTAEGNIMDCRWEDTSGDGYDDHYGTNTRYVTFLVTYREP
jgi:hypothetical protein